jgi:asparagine N-glycosylation enzyme membrane subunit Stt3
MMLAQPKLLLEHHASQFIYFFIKPCRAYIDIQMGNWGKGYNTIPKGYPIMKYLFEHNSKLTIIAVFFQIIMLLIMYVSVIFSFVYFKKQKGLMWFLVMVLLIFCFANLTIPSITESRFRVPVMPFISILSAAGIFFLKERISKRSLVKK